MVIWYWLHCEAFLDSVFTKLCFLPFVQNVLFWLEPFMLQKDFRQRSNIDSKVVILNFQKVEPLYYPLEFELSVNCFKKS